jgi:hypothetical protein
MEGIDLSAYGIDLKDVKTVEDLKEAFKKLNAVTSEKVANNLKEIKADV